MKTYNLITTTLFAGMFALGMATQASASDATQVRFEVGSPATGGTREGTHQTRVSLDALDGQAVEHADYRTNVKVGSPVLGGTREGSHRERVEAQDNSSINPLEYAGPRVGSSNQGTRG